MAARTKRDRIRFRPLVNRLEDRTVPATHTWTGAGGNGLWSNAANWDNTAPTANEGLGAASNVILIFPAVANKATTQDITGLIVDQLQLNADGYSIQVNQSIEFRSGFDMWNRLKPQITCTAGTTDTITGGTMHPGGNMAPISVDAGCALSISAVLGGDDSGNDTGAWIKAGDGTLTLSGAGEFDQETDNQGGTVVVKNDAALSSGGSDIEDGSTVDLQANNSHDLGFFAPVNPPSKGCSLITSAGSGTQSGTLEVNVASDSPLTIGGAGHLTISGLIVGNGGMTKVGIGTTTIASTAPNMNDYQGPVKVTAGTLEVTGVLNGTTTTVTGGTLGGSGLLGNLTTTGGTVAPGLKTAPATLLTGNVALKGATFAPVVSGTTADQLSVSGSVNLTGATLAVTHGAAAVPVGTVLTVIDIKTENSVTGTFAGVPEGTVVATATGKFFKVSYKGGTGNDVTLTAVGAPAVTVSNVNVNEGDTGMKLASFNVHLSAPLAAPLTIHFKTVAGTATAGKDFVAVTDRSVTIPAGKTLGKIGVNVKSDLLDEANESFSVKITSLSIGGVGGVGASATATIYDNDPTPTLSIGDVKKKEGGHGTTNFVFTVTLSAASGRVVTVNFATANLTAKSGTDFVAQTGKLTFTPGRLTRTIIVQVKGDTVKEPTETFRVKLSKFMNAGLKKGVGIGTIVNDD